MRPINNCQRLALFTGMYHSTRMLIGALQALYLLDTGVSLSTLAFLKAYFALLVLIFDVPCVMLGDMRIIYLLSASLIISLPFLIHRIDELPLHDNKIKPSINKLFFRDIFIDGKNAIYILISSLIVVAYQPMYHFWQPLFIQASE